MANHRRIDGKTTKQRLDEELQHLRDTGESVTLAEFARRARVSYEALTHQYKPVAEEVRRVRDAGRPSPNLSPATFPRTRKADLTEATNLIQQLRKQVSDLTRALSKTQTERDKWQGQAHRLGKAQDQNERLRGIIVQLSDVLACEADQRMMRRLLDVDRNDGTM